MHQKLLNIILIFSHLEGTIDYAQFLHHYSVMQMEWSTCSSSLRWAPLGTGLVPEEGSMSKKIVATILQPLHHKHMSMIPNCQLTENNTLCTTSSSLVLAFRKAKQALRGGRVAS